jgi:hypothetical protein
VFSRSIIAVALTAAVLASSASAGDVGVRLTMAGGGSLSLAYAPAAGGGAVLNGADQTMTYPVRLVVIDSRSDGAGWNVTVAATSFDDSAGKAFDPVASITSATVDCRLDGGCTAPRNLVGYPVPMPPSTAAAAPVKIFNADQGSGMGVFSVTPTVAVSIPGNTFAGTYVSTLAVAVVSGP